jgi:hypothetical protein
MEKMWFALYKARGDIVVQREMVGCSLKEVGDEYVESLGEEDPDAIIEGFVKVRAKEEAVGNVPSHVDVIRHLIEIPYLHVITQVPSLFFLRTEMRSLSSS